MFNFTFHHIVDLILFTALMTWGWDVLTFREYMIPPLILQWSMSASNTAAYIPLNSLLCEWDRDVAPW